MSCKRCGEESKPGDVYCRNCGASLAPPSPPTPPAHYPGVARRTSGWAVASLVFGALAYMCLPVVGAVLAVIFGVMGRREVKRSGDGVGGLGISTAGMVLGAINLAFFIIFMGAFIPWVVIRLGETRTVTRKVNLRGAEEVVALLEMREGEMVIGQGSGTMFEGTFTYSADGWEPDIDYVFENGDGKLSVKQGADGWSESLWRRRNCWDISFGDEVPLEIDARLHAGNGSFELSSPSLIALDIESGSGEVSADLSGEMSSLRRVNIKQGSGSIALNLKGKYTSYTILDVENGSGNLDVDLSGTWESSLDASLINSSGDVTLRLPKEVGVRVKAKAYSGNIEAPGLEEQGEDEEGITYANNAYGESIITLYIEVEVHRGDIHLSVED